MNINNITPKNPPVAFRAPAYQYQPVTGNQSTNSVYRPDNLALGNVPSPYQTYTATPMPQTKKLNAETFFECLALARVNLSDMLKINLGLEPLPPNLKAARASSDGFGWQFPNLGPGEGLTTILYLEDLTDEEAEFIKDFYSKIQEITQSEDSIRNALALADSGKELSDDEKINAIIAKYAGKPLDREEHRIMMHELEALGLFDQNDLSNLTHMMSTSITAKAWTQYKQQIDIYPSSESEPSFVTPDLEEQFLENLDAHNNELTRQREQRGELENENSHRFRIDPDVLLAARLSKISGFKDTAQSTE